MAGISAQVAAEAQHPTAAPRGQRDEEADHVADFLDAWEQGHAATAAPAAPMAGGGYTSDDEVRAAAAAAAGDEAVPRGMELLPPLDHAGIDYAPFAKALYEVRGCRVDAQRSRGGRVVFAVMQHAQRDAA